MGDQGVPPLTGFPRTWAFSGTIWRVVCVECGDPLKSPVAIVSDGKTQLAYCSNPTRCSGKTNVREYSFGDHSGYALIPTHLAREFQEVRKWQREHPRKKKEKPAPGITRRDGSWEMEYSLPINLGVVDCPICESPIRIRAHISGPTAQPATASCPHCDRPLRLELLG